MHPQFPVKRASLLASGLTLVAALLACKQSARGACDDSNPCPAGSSCLAGNCEVNTALQPGEAQAPAANVPGPGARGRSTAAGDPSIFPYGYYDVSGRDQKNDFCQVDRATRTLQCDTGSGSFSSQTGLDLGYPRTGRMEDANGDGREDFCRCVGDSPNIRYSCLLSLGTSFSTNQYGLNPPGRTSCDFLNAKAAPAATLPPPPPSFAGTATDDCAGKCNFSGTRCVSGACLLAPGEMWIVTPMAVRVYEGRSCGGRCNASICIANTDGSDRHCTPSFDFAKGANGISDDRGRYRLGVYGGKDNKVVTTEDLLRDGVQIEFVDGTRRIERFPKVGRFDGISAGSLLFKGGLVLRLQGNLFYSITVKLEHYVPGD